MAPPLAMPTIASMTARRAATHRDRERFVAVAGSRPVTSRFDWGSSLRGGIWGTGAPVNGDINRRSLPPREATTNGPKGRDDVDREVGYSPSPPSVAGVLPNCDVAPSVTSHDGGGAMLDCKVVHR